MDIYTKEHLLALEEEFNNEGKIIAIDVPDMEIYFDGLCNVYEGTLTAFEKGSKDFVDYDITITPKAYAYYCNGDD